MGEIRTRDKRDKLRLLYAGLNGKRLRQSLYDALKICDDALNGPTPGTWLASSAEAGGSNSFMAVQGFSPMDAKRLIGELLDYCDDCITTLGGDPEVNASYADKDVYGMMLATLKPVRRFKNDYTGMRYPTTGYYIG